MTPYPKEPLPVRRIKRDDLAPNGNSVVANPQPRATVSLADVRAQVIEIKRRLNALDALLKQATDSTTE